LALERLFLVTVQLLRLDTGLPFIDAATEQTNSDGSVSYALPGGGFGGQAPGVYGGRNDNPEAKQYQRARPNGNLVVFQPEAAFPPAAYLRVVSQVFPA
jgi:hypothetical protein